MTHYLELSSTKYWLKSVKQQQQEIQRQKNLNDLKALALGATSILFMFVSFYTMPVWVSAIIDFLDAVNY